MFKTYFVVSIPSTFVFKVLNSVFSIRPLATLLDNLAKSPGTVCTFPTSNLSTSAFKLAKLVFNAKPDVST